MIFKRLIEIMIKEVLIVLGSPNDSIGELSNISKSRLDYCESIFNEGKLVLCTGGWGAHFNTTINPHATYAKEYLIKKGFLESDFLDIALSSNTVDDAVKIKPILSELKNIKLTIITSDYHLKRVKLIFSQILKEYKIQFIGVDSNLEKEDYDLLVIHENEALKYINEKGLSF